ncbi:PIG-L deacetylase family protein [Bradyrhizobium sp. HKCCYLR20261]|uniref:PIG-L deacetylase family protein n=1 Tax=Bradyrhizobium sp. HKCCYLR20261 TaxID=3420760 RepID=UPI003EBC3C96
MRADRFLDALSTSPVVTVDELVHGRPLVVLSPHPDDESLGAGGLIAESRAAGHEVNVIVVTDGSGSHPRSRQYPRQKLVALRYAEVHAAGRVLGVQPDHVTFLGLPDTRAPMSGPDFDAAVETTLKVVRRSGAGALFVTWEGDPHCDHQASAALAKAVRRASPGLKLWAYPVWGWHLAADVETQQPPLSAVRIDISSQRGRKRAAIDAHASQMTDLISDDPDGFRFDDASLAPFLGPYEYFIEVPS